MRRSEVPNIPLSPDPPSPPTCPPDFQAGRHDTLTFKGHREEFLYIAPDLLIQTFDDLSFT